MKRDMDLVRDILIEIENGKLSEAKQIGNYDKESVLYHIQIMNEAGLLLANFISESTRDIVDARIDRLTWKGHDFLDAARDDTLWKKAKDFLKQKFSTVAFDVLLKLLIKLSQESLGL